jgi:DNA-binding response OmpR family regulator
MAADGDPRVLVMTDSAEAAATGAVTRAGRVRVLDKPFAMDALGERVRAIIDGR